MLQGYSDEELVKVYRQGDNNAMDILMERYKGIVRHKAKAMYIAGGDRDDLIQEGMIGLYKAIRDFRFEKNVKFATFAGLCIDRHMCTAISAANRKKYQPLNESISINAVFKTENDEEVSLMEMVSVPVMQGPEEEVIQTERMQELWDDIEKSLSKYEKQVFAYHMEGRDYKEIAMKLGKTPKSVDNAIQRIKNKISEVI